MSRRTLIAVGGIAALVGLVVLAILLTGAERGRRGPLPGLRVSGNRLLDADGRPLHVAGINRSGSEYACVQGRGIFDGPVDDASISVMAAWGINAVRIPLNEDCWLGRGRFDSRLIGAPYRRAIHAFVNRLLAHRLDVILDLQWIAPPGQRALRLQPAPDAAHAAQFWTSVARQFRDVAGVAYDLFNEPHAISWSCWRDGCVAPGGWRTAGMQLLISTIRAAGSRQPVIAEGVGYGADLSGWLAHRPADPAHQLVAGWHMYDRSLCRLTSCWSRTVAPVARRFPVLATEVGETDCHSTFLRRLLPWADRHAIGYLAWTWNPTGCTTGPALIRDYAGTPTPYGAGFLAHIRPALLAARRYAVTSSEFSRATGGWTVRWGSALSLSSVPRSPPAPPGLTLHLTGRGWPAVGSDQGLAAVGAGSTVMYRLWAPGKVPASISPMLTSFDWRVTLLGARRLHPGWNMIRFTVPARVRDVRVVGLQLNNPAGWRGTVVLGGMTWSPVS